MTPTVLQERVYAFSASLLAFFFPPKKKGPENCGHLVPPLRLLFTKIVGVFVYMQDLNGPKEHVHKPCTFLEGMNGWQVVVVVINNACRSHPPTEE